MMARVAQAGQPWVGEARWASRVYECPLAAHRQCIKLPSLCIFHCEILIAGEMRVSLVLMLVGLALLELCTAAGAYSICPNEERPITCCKSLREVRGSAPFPWLVRYICDQCDPGFVPSANREQCKPGNVCKPGYGLIPSRTDTCHRCADNNCKECYESFLTCTKCQRGFSFYQGYDWEVCA